MRIHQVRASGRSITHLPRRRRAACCARAAAAAAERNQRRRVRLRAWLRRPVPTSPVTTWSPSFRSPPTIAVIAPSVTPVRTRHGLQLAVAHHPHAANDRGPERPRRAACAARRAAAGAAGRFTLRAELRALFGRQLREPRVGRGAGGSRCARVVRGPPAVATAAGTSCPSAANSSGAGENRRLPFGTRRTS